MYTSKIHYFGHIRLKISGWRAHSAWLGVASEIILCPLLRCGPQRLLNSDSLSKRGSDSLPSSLQTSGAPLIVDVSYCHGHCLTTPWLGAPLEEGPVLQNHPDYSELEDVDGELSFPQLPCTLDCLVLERSTPAWKTCICCYNFPVIGKEWFTHWWGWGGDQPR